MTQRKPSDNPSSHTGDPFDDLYRQYDETTGSNRSGDYQRLGTQKRYTAAARSTPPVAPTTRHEDLVEGLFLLAEAVWELTRALRTEQDSEDGDDN